MDMNYIEDMAIGFQPWVLDCATFATMRVKQDMVVEDRPMRHYSIVLRKRAGQNTERARSKGLKRDSLANWLWAFLVIQKHNAGLTEETNKMIQEVAQNCH
jgi:hypothetical protein